MKRSGIILAVLLMLMASTVALACRYTVRDIGFVRLSEPRIELVLFGGGHPASVLEALESELPIRVTRVDPDHQPDHVGLPLAGENGVSAVLRDERGRLLPVADPLVVGRTRLARMLAEDAAETFAHVLVLEGPDPESNSVAEAEVARLDDGLRAIEEHLPRPLGHPLKVMTLTPADQELDRVLLWSLGIDLPLEDTTTLITYGRAKRAGAPVTFSIENRADAARELLAQLALVGESCECDTTRAWTEEPEGLVPWTRATHSVASSSLGFDSESPMVRAEVSRILFRGGTSPNAADPRPDSLEELLLGYDETTLEPALPTAEPVVDGPASARDGPDAPLTVVAASPDDDWSFTDVQAAPSVPAGPGGVEEAGSDGPPAADADTAAPPRWSPLYAVIGMVVVSFAIAFIVVRRMEARP